MLYRSSMHALLLVLVRRISKAKQAVLCVFSGPTYPRSSAAASSSSANPLAQRTRLTLFARTTLARDPWEARTRVPDQPSSRCTQCLSPRGLGEIVETAPKGSRAQNQKILYHKVHVNLARDHSSHVDVAGPATVPLTRWRMRWRGKQTRLGFMISWQLQRRGSK